MRFLPHSPLFSIILSILVSLSTLPHYVYSDGTLSCTLAVPPNPLNATGLATPYILSGENCSMSNIDQSAAFIQAAIVDLTNGDVYLYHPLVIDNDTKPLEQPTVPVLPDVYEIGIWFGFSGNNLTLVNQPNSNGLIQGNCVNGGGLSEQSNFGQFAYCNAPAFFTAVNTMIGINKLPVPHPGYTKQGKQCPTVRDWVIVDQTPSDNVGTKYIRVGKRTAQYTVENIQKYSNSSDYELADNGSDNGFLNNYILPALGCNDTVWTAKSLDDPNGPHVGALPFNELQAAMYAPLPYSRIPSLDPMVLNTYNSDGLHPEDTQDLFKLNAYRRGVNMLPAIVLDDADTSYWCYNLFKYGATRLYEERTLYTSFNDTWVLNTLGGNLYQFLVQRFYLTISNLPSPAEPGAGGLGCFNYVFAHITGNFTGDIQGLINATENMGQNYNNRENLNTNATAELINWFENTLIQVIYNSMPPPPTARPTIARFDRVRESGAFNYIPVPEPDKFHFDVSNFFLGFCIMLIIGTLLWGAVLLYRKIMNQPKFNVLLESDMNKQAAEGADDREYTEATEMSSRRYL